MSLAFFLSCLPWSSGRNRASQFRARKQQPRPTTVRLYCEPLEDRLVPSTLTVLNNADSGTGSLRAVIEGAHNGDTIVFASQLQGGSTITLAKQIKISKGLDIEGPGAASLTLSGNDQTGIFDINKGTVTIAGLTLAHGRAGQGGAIFNEAGASLTLSNLLLINNQATASTFDTGGGGALHNRGKATVIHCTFVSNLAPASPTTGLGLGGAIENFTGTLAITQSSFSGNKALTVVDGGDGGAIDNTDGQVSITDTTFTDNQVQAIGPDAEAIGGAVFNFDTTLLPGSKKVPDPSVATMTLTNCTFTTNKTLGTARALAGAIGNFGGTMIVSHTTVNNNLAFGGTLTAATGDDAAGAGGGMYSRFGIVAITNSTFSGNQAIGSSGGDGSTGGAVGGGAISFDGATATIDACTFSGNSAIGGRGGRGAPGGNADGGAIELGAGINTGAFARHIDAHVSISNSTFTNNRAVGGAGGSGAKGGNGIGGAIASAIDVLLGQDDASSLTLTGCTLSNNFAIGGPGGAGGNGGDGLGGALSFLGGVSSITGTTLSGNLALGGNGTPGGNGFGGGIHVAGGATLNVTQSTITKNQAQGGSGTGPAQNGQGVGGGVNDLGSFAFDGFTAITRNHASTSNDNIFP